MLLAPAVVGELANSQGLDNVQSFALRETTHDNAAAIAPDLASPNTRLVLEQLLVMHAVKSADKATGVVKPGDSHTPGIRLPA